MPKQIRNVVVTNIQDKPYKTAQLDTDGTPVKDTKSGETKLKSAYVTDLVKAVLFSIPRSIAKPNDNLRLMQILRAVDRAEGDIDGDTEIVPAKYLILHDRAYKWFHMLLSRPIPLTREAKDMVILPYYRELWQANGVWIKEQLRDENVIRTYDELISRLEAQEEDAEDNIEPPEVEPPETEAEETDVDPTEVGDD